MLEQDRIRDDSILVTQVESKASKIPDNLIKTFDQKIQAIGLLDDHIEDDSRHLEEGENQLQLKDEYWDALNNIPSIEAYAKTGEVWVVGTSGGHNLGSINVWNQGDLAIKTNSGWERISSQDVQVSIYQVGESVNSFTPVSLVNGEVFKVDELDFIKSENMIGVSLQSGTTIGDSIKVKTIGVIKDQSWNWTVGSRIFIKNGNFSDIPPDDGHLISIGSAVSSNEINIKISEVVIL